MNELKVFSHPDFGEVRTVTINDEPWFVGKDVAEKLGYRNSKDALISHVDEDDKRILQRSEIATLENHIPKDALPVNFVSGDVPNRGLTLINESGLYSLILSSKLPGAKEFKRWITHDVIPSIRKHGAYMTPETLEAAVLNPHFVRKLCDQLIESQGKCKELEATNSALTVENQIMAPKASYFDQLVDRNTLTNFRETAKALNVAPKAFVSFLLEKKYIYRDKKGKLLPYENRNEGLFEVKECYNEKTQWGGTQTLVTPKGREAFRLLYVGA